ncbi:MAG TPA: tRNA threonylcarbamoyladenosine dehydratase [Casimicrobiaceae bacterium]|nr:tRNA threonylcarbamoyladenosine dehydratase [Casimicrobiaceae bacterium]
MTASIESEGPDLVRRFAGVTRLYGEAAAERFRAAHAVVVGIGGVGSWAAEALARSAVGRLTLVDLDHVAESNTNRQIHALGDEYGKAKVDAMAERVRAINPACQVRAIDEFASVDNAAALVEGADVVVDCIDQVIAKAALIAAARAAGVAIVTCGAAGGRFDPTRVRCDDLARLSGDPLLAKVRHKLRRDHGFPRDDSGKRPARFGVTGVYSDEPLQRPAPVCDADGRPVAGAALACAGYGSSVVVTAGMGFVAAGQALALLSATVRGRR